MTGKVLGKYELRSAKKHGHFAIVEVVVWVEGFADDFSHDTKIAISESAVQTSDFVSWAIRLGITSALFIWREAKLCPPISVKVDVIDLAEQPPHSSHDDIQVAAAMAFLNALLDIAVSNKMIPDEEAIRIKDSLEVILDYGGKAVIRLNQSHL